MPLEHLHDDEMQNRHLNNFKRNDPELFARYMQLPEYTPGMVVRCPTTLMDGSPCGPNDICGCGSENVHYDGDVYDCDDCGIFFSDYAANPPHRRREAADPIEDDTDDDSRANGPWQRQNPRK